MNELPSLTPVSQCPFHSPIIRNNATDSLRINENNDDTLEAATPEQHNETVIDRLSQNDNSTQNTSTSTPNTSALTIDTSFTSSQNTPEAQSDAQLSEANDSEYTTSSDIPRLHLSTSNETTKENNSETQTDTDTDTEMGIPGNQQSAHSKIQGSTTRKKKKSCKKKIKANPSHQYPTRGQTNQ